MPLQRKRFIISYFALLLLADAAYGAEPIAEYYPLIAPENAMQPPAGTGAAAVNAPAPIPAPPAPAPATAFQPSGVVEAGGNYHSVSNHFGNWAGEYAKGEIQTDKDNRWNGELLHQQEFHSSGAYAAVGNTHTLNEDWFSNINIGAGAGGDVLPRFRADAFLNRKWLEQRQLITTIGIGEYNAMDRHNDQSLFLGATYYFDIPWIMQGGIRFNQSNPGSVFSTSQFVAVTQGRDKEHFITLRYGFGKEAYQVIGPGQTLVDFNSQEVSLQLKEWLDNDWGFVVRGEHYHNPSYDRNGLTVGIFKEF